jgi:Holliday junction resolvase RusA-like endonuclease
VATDQGEKESAVKWQPAKHANTTVHVSAACGTIYNETVSAASRPVELTIIGHLPSMKNSRKIHHRRGKRFIAKSDEAICYVDSFIAQVPLQLRRLALGSEKTPLRANVSVYYRSHRSDLDTALVYDCLQKAGVIANDRYIVEHHEWKHVDAKNPRVELTIEEL